MSKANLAAVGLCCWLAGCGPGEPGPVGPTGPTGPQGSQGTVAPSIAILNPLSMFSARQGTLQIAGLGTHFTANSTVDFGDAGITTSQVVAVNETALRVTALVSDTAKLGAHDITVTTGSEVVKLTGGFLVQAPLQYRKPPTPLTVQQGGVIPLSLLNLDYRDNQFSNAIMIKDAHLSLGITPQGQGGVSGAVLVDALATKLGLTLTTTNAFGQPIDFATDPADPNAPTLAPRTAAALTVGTPVANQDLPTPYSSNLYKVTTAQADLALLLSFTNLGSTIQNEGTAGTYAPASGKFAAGRRFIATYSPTLGSLSAMISLGAAGDYYLSIYRNSFLSTGTTGYGHSVSAKLYGVNKLTLPAEAAGGDSPAAPLRDFGMLDLTKVLTASGLVLNDMFDTDYLRFTLSADATIYISVVQTSPAVPYPSGTFLSIYANPDCATNQVGMLFQPGTVDVKAGTTYCMKIQQQGDYSLMVPDTYDVNIFQP